MAARSFIGTNCWHGDRWRDIFYPPELAQPRWRSFHSKHFSPTTLNNGIYLLPSEVAAINWRQSTHPGFLFAIKMRPITHLRKLTETTLQNALRKMRDYSQ